MREAELTTGLALEDLVEVFLAEEGLAIEDFEAAQVEGTSSKISTATDVPSRSTLGKASPELERLSGGRIAVSIQGVLLDCTLAGRPLGRNLTRVGLTIRPPSFFYKTQESFNANEVFQLQKAYLGWGYGGFFDGPEMSVELSINAIVAFLTRAPIPSPDLPLLQQLILQGQAAFFLWLWYLKTTAPFQLVGEWV